MRKTLKMRQWLVSDDVKINGITPQDYHKLLKDENIEHQFKCKCLGLPEMDDECRHHDDEPEENDSDDSHH